MALRHRVLADQHEEARAGVEPGPAAYARDREVEPQLGEVLVEAVALLDSALESIGLQRAPGFECAGAVLGT